MPSSSTSVRSAQGQTSEPARSFGLDLNVPATPESLALVRQIVGTAARGVGLTPGTVADLRLALTETCSAAIRRGDPEAALDVRARAEDGVLRVVVHDDGPAPSPGENSLPLPLVAAITDAIELTHLTDGTTEVAMSFRLGDAA